MNFEKIREQFVGTLDKFDVVFDESGITANLEAYMEKKAPLINLLRNHPFWDEDELAVVYSIKEVRKVTRENVDRCLNDMYDLMYENNISERALVREALCYVTRNLTQKFTGDPEHLESMISMKFNNDQACSKIMRKILVKFGIDQIKDELNTDGSISRKGFEKVYAPLADSLSPIVLTNTAVLSVHPCDYLTMSHGNSWDSCQSIEKRGCHRSGTLSYMNDSVTMMFYTVSGKTESDYHAAPKHTRQAFYYGNDVLIQSRLYPDTYNEEQRTMYRQVVQSTMAQSLGYPNLWKIYKKQDDVDGWYDTASGSTHYGDYTYDDYRNTISLAGNPFGELLIGSRPHCLICGATYSHCDTFECGNCPEGVEDEEEVEYCFACDSMIDISDEDNFHTINDRIYCESCVTRCDDCYEYVATTWTVFNANGNEILVCERCKEEDYDYCYGCNDIFHRDTMINSGEGDDYCDECYSDNFFTCEICEKDFRNNEENYDEDERSLCNHCYAEVSVAVVA